MQDIYNPFSLVNALDSGQLADYWFDRGTSGTLINLLAQLPPVDTTAIESETYESSMFDLPFESYDDPLPILYQSGYLTLKSYEPEFNDFHLGLPNQEVRQGFAQCQGYAEKYRLDGRPVTKIGISFSSEERNITDWKAMPL